MEQNDWTRRLHDRLENHKTMVPDGLWDNIEQRLDAKSKPHKRRVALRVASWVAAAASVALLIVGGFYTNRNAVAPVSAPLSERRSADGGAAKAETQGREDVPDNLLALATGHNKAATHAEAHYAAAETVAAMAIEEGVPAYEKVQNEEQNVEENKKKAVAPTTENEAVATTQSAKRSEKRSSVPNAYAASATSYERNASRNATSRWSFGAHTGNAFTESNNTSGAIPVLSYDASADKMSNIILLNSYPSLFANYKEVKHHNQPLSVGASVSYALNKRVSLTTGLVYTRVTSDFVRSAGSDEIVDNQRLHYIGVPLAVNYNVWGIGNLRTYATIGAQADFNVKATLSSDGVNSNIKKDRPQFSGTAAVGIEYDIVPQVGIYAEPGVRYYFDNHSAVDNIFKSQPWAFNLQVGVRINVK